MGHFIICKICGKKKFINPAAHYIYCSRECREKDPEYKLKLPQRQPYNRVTLNCRECGKPFSIPKSVAFYKNGNQRIFCCSNECKYKTQAKRIGPLSNLWRGGYSSKYGPEWGYFKNIVRLRDNNTCQKC